MRIVHRFCLLFLIILINFGGIISAETITTTTTTNKIKIVVAAFKVKAPKYKKIDPNGEAFQDMLITALYKTGQFEVLERDILKEMQEELSIGKEETKYKTADIMIVGAITGFEPNYKGFIFKVATIFQLLGCLFGVLGKESAKMRCEKLAETTGNMEVKINRSYIAMDIRVVKVTTREVVGATRIETITKDVEIAGKLGLIHKDVKLASAFASFENTPIEKAIYESLEKIVNYITNLISYKK